MVRTNLSLAMLPMILATLAGCAGPSTGKTDIAAVPATEKANVAAVPASIIFGSCAQKPVYPEAALREKREGTVALTFLIDADSTELDAKVKKSSGHADLDDAARVGLAKCKFRAATQNGMPVRDWAAVQYVWRP